MKTFIQRFRKNTLGVLCGTTARGPVMAGP
jgi:hypothetical protein